LSDNKTPSTKKVTLLEMDIGFEWEFWANESSNTWVVNKNKSYPNVDSDYLNDIPDFPADSVGSVTEDTQALELVGSLASVQANPGTFYWDGSNLYVHCTDSHFPDQKNMVIGEVFGWSNIEKNYNNIQYESRIDPNSIPRLTQSKDPLFFGKINFQGGNIKLINNDGNLDSFGEDNDVLGNDARLLIGYDDQTYDEYEIKYEGYIERLNFNRGLTMGVELQDKRKQLSRVIPTEIFDTTNYPNIKDSNANKPIPIGYGDIFNAPVICNNEDATPPVSYSFKIVDTTYHEIKSIDTVKVNGSAVTPATTDTATATFTITSASGDYSPGDEVTVDFEGYIDDDSNLIENGVDVILDIIDNYTNLVYDSVSFNTSTWIQSQAIAPDINYFLDDTKKIVDVFEEILGTIQADFFVENDGRYSLVIFNAAKEPILTITGKDMLEVPSYTYDPTEILTSVRIKYEKNWAEDTYKILIDDDDETTRAQTFKQFVNKDYDTLLTTSADAQTFADNQFIVSGDIQKIVTFKTKLQTIDLNITDFILVDIERACGDDSMLGRAKCEVINIVKDLNNFEITIKARILEFVGQEVTQETEYWGNTYWGGSVWANGQIAEES
jgi:hypothetical protein